MPTQVLKCESMPMGEQSANQEQRYVLGPCFVAPKVLREEAASAEIVPRKWPKVPFYRASALQTDIKIE